MKFTEFITIFIVILLSYSCSDSTEIITNHAPTAVFSYIPVIADTSTIIQFDASESSDQEDLIGQLVFKWDFEGRHNWTDVENDPKTNYKYTKAGTYIVSLKVIDTEGWSGETTKTIIIRDSI